MYPPQTRGPGPVTPTGGNGQLIRRATLKPARFTATLPGQVYADLVDAAGAEGRSISNLAAHLLEMALQLWRQRQQVNRSPADQVKRY